MDDRLQRVFAEFDIGGTSRKRRPGYVLPVLQRVQREFGYLPPEVFPEVAGFIGVPESHVWGVATFFAHFRFKPTGTHSITICCGTACHVRGSATLASNLSEKLGIQPGDTTDDLHFSVQTTACFGSCALAPVVVVDDKVHGRMNWSRLSRIVDQLRAPSGAELETVEEAAS